MLSLTHRFAFVHVNKAGGTSVVEALADCEDVQPFIKDHDQATIYRNVLGSELWDEFYSFAFLRNPYDRMVSSYEYRRQYDRGPGAEAATRLSFRDWMLGPVTDDPLDREWSNQLWMVCEEGDYSRMIVKDVFLYDDHAAGFGAACAKIGIVPPQIAVHNKTEREPWQGYYEADTAALVRERFSHDLAWAERHHHGRWAGPKV